MTQPKRRKKRSDRPHAASASWAGFTLLLLLTILAGVVSAANPTFQRPVRLHVEGVLTPLTEQTLIRHLDRAKSLGADLIIVEIDSPGGQLMPSLGMAHQLQEVNWARTVAYVPRRAISGGAVVALGCDEIVMAPLATLGDVGPLIAGEDGAFRHAPEKVVSILARQLRDLAEAKNRPGAIAEAMADKELQVFRVEQPDTKRIVFMTKRELDGQVNKADWKVLGLVVDSGKGRFLTLNGKQAVEFNLSGMTANDPEDLKVRLGVEGDVTELDDTWVDGAVSFLNHPIVSVLLVVTGLVCLYVEFAMVGMGLAGLPAALCFLLFFWSRFLGGTAGWLEVVMFGAGVVCLAVEIFVLPGTVVLGLTGVCLIVVSLIMASQGFVLPRTATDLKTTGQTLLQLAAGFVVFVGALAFLSQFMGSLPIFQRFMLKPTDDPSSAPTPDGMRLPPHGAFTVGAGGTALTDLRPAGKVMIGARTVDVVADGFFVPAGAPVDVVEVTGNRIVVRQASEA